MLEDGAEKIARRFRLQTWHQIISAVGIPIIVTMGGIIGAMVLKTVSDMEEAQRALFAHQEELLEKINTNKTDIAVINSNQTQIDTRVVKLEDWRDRVNDGHPIYKNRN